MTALQLLFLFVSFLMWWGIIALILWGIHAL